MSKRLDPRNWASWKPFGIGERKPNNYLELVKAFRSVKGSRRYALRLLRQGTCDGCALGTKGMRDWTMDEIHLCNIRLRLLKLNTMPALDVAALADVSGLARRSSAELRDLGRLPYPMLRRAGEAGFTRIGWDEALDLAAPHLRDGSRLGVFLTSRGIPNENYFAAQKAVRALGSNSVDNAARICHSPSTVTLKRAIGAAATTCSYTDWIGSDLIVFIGSNPSNNQPVAMKYLYHAKKAGTRIAMVNAYREPGMDKYWVPSNAESAVFGTKITDHFFGVNIGGDIGFLNGVLKHLVENDWVDEEWVDAHTTGFEDVRRAVAEQSWEELEALSGAGRESMFELAKLLGQARSAVLVWSMGVTQHTHGEDNVQSIVNLALARGFVGRDRCGLMPIRGHSGVQGGAEMGAYATGLPGGLPITEENARHFGELWGFEVPTAPGLTTTDMIDRAHAGELDVLVSSGGNFLEVLPDPDHCREALSRLKLRVHIDIVLSSQMLVPPEGPDGSGGDVLLLPAQTRYEMAGGVTETSTERRIIFSPEVPGPRIGEARPEWQIFTELAARARPELAGLIRYSGTPEIRADIERAVPFYAGVSGLSAFGDNVQYGGRHLCPGGRFPTPDGRGRFSAVALPVLERPDGAFMVATRRGKQFNSMVHERRDGFNGATREAVLMSAHDADRLGLPDGTPVELRSLAGGRTFRGRVLRAPLTPGNLQIHWPEGNVLLDAARRSPDARIPDYNALVTIAKLPS
ncbi:FdhF/YdeP family oxidoreductase [Planomonospora venezuelensis]|uniref:Molybdopterin-dependent oxidoreductase alpha subunit n=1 Tax=Planomonospora venezuelensis TaxID=1999 RepID=A0A841D3X9_PLAVE|nr:FdhF/YdeP family oxidoreductase [Planomonospora venezuelensis]MBB5962186.1 molybdopterin-dependent oxidoreductase alpha subunit [Planomonospora venezuelensis]GIN00951.1 formate dehydrogenase [Planomonospora venezuelensis]